MNIWLILLALQVIVTVCSLCRERGEDKAFEGDKLGYRSYTPDTPPAPTRRSPTPQMAR